MDPIAIGFCFPILRLAMTPTAAGTLSDNYYLYPGFCSKFLFTSISF